MFMFDFMSMFESLLADDNLTLCGGIYRAIDKSRFQSVAKLPNWTICSQVIENSCWKVGKDLIKITTIAISSNGWFLARTAEFMVVCKLNKREFYQSWFNC